jgi:hypothetical protein
MAAQFFIGCKSKFKSIVPLMDSDVDFPAALMEEIRKHGAINGLLSDSDKAEISARVKEILGMLVIGDWQSEPHHQHQNPAELGWRDTKEWSNIQLNTSGAPPECWLLVLAPYRTTLLTKVSEWRILGYTPDISIFLRFIFYEPVLHMMRYPSFPKDSTELLGRFVGIRENVGHGMSFLILTETGKIITHSVVRSALG